MPGFNCQVLESVYTHKFSRHLLLYAPGMVNLTSKRFAKELYDRCFALSMDHADRRLLTWEKKGKPLSAFDQEIYTKNRKMRMAFCCKLDLANPMLPVLGSSTDVAAHMVNVAPPEVFTPPLMLPPLDISLLPEDSKSAAKAVRARLSSCIGLAGHGASPGNDAVDPDESLRATPCWQPGQLAKLRADLQANPGILQRLGLQRLVFGKEKTSDNGRAHFFYIKVSMGILITPIPATT